MAGSVLLVGLSYALCVLSGISILLGVATSVLVVIHRQLAKRGTMKYIRHGTLLMVLANSIANVGVILVMLWNGTTDRLYCEAGGFLLLFGVLESVWILLVGAICLAVQLRSRLPGRAPLAKLRERWNVPIFLLSVLLKAVVLAMLTFLALTKVGFFSGQSSSCRILATLGADSWQYSAMALGVAWVAVVPATAISVGNVFANGTGKNPLCRKRKFVAGPAKFGRWLAIVHLMNALLWSVVLMTATVVVFSADGVFDKSYTNVGFGYGVTLAVIAATMAAIVVLVLSNRWRYCDLSDAGDREALLWGDPPNSLVSLTKLPNHKDDLNRYVVHWFGQQRTLFSGVMKVYQPASIARWRSEVNAVAKLTAANHPNLARYLWESDKNKFAPEICTFTGDLLSPECSIICMQHYPHGTLAGYLKTRSHMTEVGLYKVTLDVARGLGYIHQNHLVHNALTTETIYMASLAGKIGLRAVIGDFEKSYEVSENTLRKSPLMLDRSRLMDSCSLGSLYSISQQLDMDGNKFAPDIRSFGMVVLEMLIALGEFDEHSEAGIHYRNAGHVRRNSAYDNDSVDVDWREGADRERVDARPVSAARQVLAVTGRRLGGKPRHLVGSDSNLDRRHGGKDCNCSPRVTDIRAVKCRSLEATPIHIGGNVSTTNCGLGESRQTEAGKSAFTALKPKTEPDLPVAAVHAPQTKPKPKPKPKPDVQNRNLPPLPPKNIKSPRRYRSANQKPPNGYQTREQVSPPSAKLLAASNGEAALSISIGDASDSQSNHNCDFSPCSDQDFYSLSVGSFGSFETIYEDEERGSAKGERTDNGSSPTRPGRTVVSKPPVLKRKMADGELQKRRCSVSSANDSVFSVDSGIGSYSSDTYSELSALTYGHRTWLEAHRSAGGGRHTESPDVNPVLLIRKKPCSRRHPAPTHHCHSSQPSADLNRSGSDGNYGGSYPTDSSLSNSDTLSSDEPTYELIASLKRADVPSAPVDRVRQLAPKVDDGLNVVDSAHAHPAIRQQYSRYAVPRLGISAVLARRLSDASVSSVTSCSTHRSLDVDRKSASDDPKSAKRSKSRPTSAPRSAPAPSGDESAKDEGQNLSSSVLSIIQDSRMLLDQSSDSPAGAQMALKALPDSCTPPSRRVRNESKARKMNQDRNSITKLLESSHLDPKEKGRLLNMLKLINGNDKLGVIGKQMMTLFKECWLEEPVPSADELFQRLNLVLPSAAV